MLNIKKRCPATSKAMLPLKEQENAAERLNVLQYTTLERTHSHFLWSCQSNGEDTSPLRDTSRRLTPNH